MLPLQKCITETVQIPVQSIVQNAVQHNLQKPVQLFMQKGREERRRKPVQIAVQYFVQKLMRRPRRTLCREKFILSSATWIGKISGFAVSRLQRNNPLILNF
jgi:hypothetical protein